MRALCHLGHLLVVVLFPLPQRAGADFSMPALPGGAGEHFSASRRYGGQMGGGGAACAYGFHIIQIWRHEVLHWVCIAITAALRVQ